MFGPNAIDPEIAAEYPPIPKMIFKAYLNPESSSGTLMYKFVDVFEKAFEVIGIGATVVGTLLLNDYITDIKLAKEEARKRLKNEKRQ